MNTELNVSAFPVPAPRGGFTVIHVNDDTGRPCITLQVDDHGNPSICLFTRNNAPGVSMAVNSGRGNGLSITTSEGKPCIMMGVPGPELGGPRAQTPEITVVDEQRHRVWSVFGGEHDVPEGQDNLKTDSQ